MRKQLIPLALAIVLIFTLGTPVLAADYTYFADELHNVGVFQGTDVGYELDASATRAQAAVMLVRLLGQEQNAENGGFTHPFTDVPDWASVAVGYLYTNKLTNGVSDTKFDPNALCTAQMYATFALRSLGYSDKDGDFRYADAIAFGEKSNIVNDALAADTFTRDKMVAVSYNALLAATKGGADTKLLQKLTADGAIAADKSSVLLERAKVADEFKAALASAMDSLGNETSLTIDGVFMGNGTITAGSKKTDLEIGAAIRADIGDKITLLAEVLTKSDVEKSFRLYVKDGTIYLSLPADGAKSQNIKFPLNLMLVEQPTSVTLDPKAPNFIASNLPAAVEKTVKDGQTSYTLHISGLNHDNLIVRQLSEMLSGIAQADAKSLALDAVFTFDSGNKLTELELTGNVIAAVQQNGKPAVCDLKFDAAFIFNDKINIAFPTDLNTFVDVSDTLRAGTETV
jgi:hypothetical protein